MSRAERPTKQQIVVPLFNTIAPGYDRFTRLFSFGLDPHWKRTLVRNVWELQPPDGAVLDLGCGTGDMLQLLLRGSGKRTVVGVDPAAEMLRIARQRTPESTAGEPPGLVRGDAMRLPLHDASVAVAAAGYCFRNTPDYRGALREVARVVRPGGVLATLDFYLPRNPLWRVLFLRYLLVSGSAAGWLWHRAPFVYAYIAHSLRGYITAEQFSEELLDVGFEVEREWSWFGGGIVLHIARRVTAATRTGRFRAAA